jgi:G3E family GTPase
MKTAVVCGLLGCGKTTFIKNYVKHSGVRTVVLVNDFGAAGIDGEIFSAGGVEAIELPSGCVCCTLRFDLITAMNRVVREFAPEHLMIEPSGVASPSGVLEALGSAGIERVSVIGIVDVTEFSELYDSGMYGPFFRDQIENSDVVLVNKTDLAGDDKIIRAMLLIESINPRAILLRSVNAEPEHLRPAAVMDGARRGRGGSVISTENHFHFETLSFKLSRDARLARLSAFLDELAQGRYGFVARAKALIRTVQGPYRGDLVFGKIDCTPFERDVDDSRIVIIGHSLDSRALQQAVKRISS